MTLLTPALLCVRFRGFAVRFASSAAVSVTLFGSAVVAAEPAYPEYERSENFERLDVEGWTVRVHQSLRGDRRDLGDRTLDQVRSHLMQVKTRVPAPILEWMRQIPIWINVRPESAACYHPDRSWLIANGHNPDKAKAIEIPTAETYLRYSADQQSIVLHELAHAYHDQVLGFDEPRIAKRFAEAKEAGLYDAVLRASGQIDRHYALSSPQEFFAEMSEAYFAANDFFPFVRAELKRHDPATYDLLAEIWETRP